MAIRCGEQKFFPVRDVEELIWARLDYPDLIEMSRVNRACYHSLRERYLRGWAHVQMYVEGFNRSYLFISEFKWLILQECSSIAIDWLRRYRGFEYGQVHLTYLCRYGRLDLIQGKDFRIDSGAFDAACESGNVALVEYCLSKDPVLRNYWVPPKVVETLMHREYLGILQLLTSLHPRLAEIITPSLWLNAIYNLNFPMVRWLISVVPGPLDLSDGFKHAIYTDQLEMAQLLWVHSSPQSSDLLLYLLPRIKTPSTAEYLRSLLP